MYRALVTLSLALALAACARPPAAAVPTPTLAPSATPRSSPTSRPSATPSPAASVTPRPSATLSPAASATPAATGAGDTIFDAMKRTAAADIYSLAINLQGSGGVSGAASGAPAAILTMKGDFAGADYRFNAGGFLATFLGADPTRGLQAMQVDGTSYLRGPVSFLGAPDEVWYRLDRSQAVLAAPPVSAKATLGLLAISADTYVGYTAGATEQRDSQRCQSYRGNKTATVVLLQSLAQSGLPAPSDPNQIDKAESAILVCPDGYVHAIIMAFSGRNPGDPPTPFSYDLDVQLSGFDAALSISAPADARDLPTAPAAPGTGPTP